MLRWKNGARYIAAAGWCAITLSACAKIAGLDQLAYGPGMEGAVCSVGSDCVSGMCSDEACQPPRPPRPPSCMDGVRNGGEADIDCGGSCEPCDAGRQCEASGDCASRLCVEGFCQKATCKDGVRNGDEEDVDCGGSCPLCPDGQTCTQDAECQSGHCFADVCVRQCADHVKDGNETDTDCGGPDCPHCASGKKCNNYLDCAWPLDCPGGICQS